MILIFMLFGNILVPYDGSKYSLHAFKVALDMAQRYDSKVTVLTCLAKPGYRGVWYQDSRYAKAVLKKEEKAARENISKMLDPVKQKTDVSINFKIIPTVHIAEQITSFAKSPKLTLS